MSDVLAAIPKPWKQPAALIMVLAAVIVATVASMAWAGSQVDKRAAAIVQPVQQDLKEHKDLEDQRHVYEDAHIKSIEEKLDTLLLRR